MQYHIFSPYRVCPLGAHVDHQHGLVTGFAMDKGVDLRFDVREDGKVNLEWFGSLGKASCDSSIHNYECGSPELQAIYQAMLTTDGIYGGRFSGAGFKGACIALVDPAKKESIEKEITEKYLAQFPQYRDSFKVFFCKSDDGARFIQ